MNIAKTILGVALLGITSFSVVSCGGTQDKNETAKTTETGDKTKAEIKDEKLYSFMLGGVYFFQGYGGAASVFNSMLKPSVSASPGEDEFVQQLHEGYNSYFIYPFKTTDGAGCKSTLAEWWDINNKEEFLATLNSLLEKGHQAKFQALKKLLDDNGGANADVNNIKLEDEDERERLQFLKDNYASLTATGIKAWDIARYVNNVCMGYCAGYVTEAEGDKLLQQLPPVARATYSDWKAYYTDYELGRRFWGGDKSSDAEFATVVKAMQEGDYSIYKYMPFK